MRSSLPRPSLRISARSPLLLAAAFFLIIFQESCGTMQKEVRASADLGNQHEGGPSAVEYSDVEGANISLNFIFGMSVGTGDISVDDYYKKDDKGSFVLMPGIQFVQKGAKLQDEKSRLNYLEIPCPVIYQYPMEDKGTLYGGLGPYIAYGIGGKTGNSSFKEASFGGDEGYKRFDAGLTLAAGYRLPSSLSFTLTYDYGLINKSPNPDDYTSRNRSVGLNIGYSLDKIIGAFKKK